MIQKFIHYIRNRGRSWRTMSLSELGEIYIAMTLRSLALAVIGVFIPVYLYQYGYSVSDILVFFAVFFTVRSVADIAGGFIVARWGPKHSMMLSNFLLIAALVLFVLLPTYRFGFLWPAVALAAANSIFFIAFHVDFSKIKHQKSEGHELGTMFILERIGGVIGPLLGGVLAYVFDDRIMFVVAAIILLAGFIPLLMTVEPVKTKQKLHFTKLNIRPIWRDFVSYGFVGIENNMRLMFWPLYLTVALFTAGSYLKIGGIVSVGILAAIISTTVIGKLVDRRKGKLLLQVSSVGTALVHIVRPFVTTTLMAFGVSIIGDITAVGHRIPYTKGVYDAADSHPGLRIVYLVSMESFSSICKGVVWLELFLLSQFLVTQQVFYIGFFMMAAAGLLITTQRFKALEL